MNQSIKELIKFGTIRVIGLLESISEENCFVQPDGFANNIAWNAGHLLVVRQNLIYRSSGLDTGLPADWGPMYKAGSSPADWEKPHTVAEIVAKIKEMQAKLEQDIDADLFSQHPYHKFDIRGTPINSAEDGALFSLWHEGLHLGQMAGIYDVLNKG